MKSIPMTVIGIGLLLGMSTASAIGPLLGTVVLLALLLWGIKQPQAWAVAAVLAIAIGVGCLGYGVSKAILAAKPSASVQSQDRLVQSQQQDAYNRAVSQASILIGSGAGAAVGGIVLLVVTLLRLKKAPGSLQNKSVNPTGNRPAS